MAEMPPPVQREPAQPDDWPAHQLNAHHLAEAFRDHDLDALRRLTTDELGEQRDAREQLWRYVDEMREFIKVYQEYHAARVPMYNAVMAMRDLAAALADNAGHVAKRQRT